MPSLESKFKILSPVRYKELDWIVVSVKFLAKGGPYYDLSRGQQRETMVKEDKLSDVVYLDDDQMPLLSEPITASEEYNHYLNQREEIKQKISTEGLSEKYEWELNEVEIRIRMIEAWKLPSWMCDVENKFKRMLEYTLELKNIIEEAEDLNNKS